MNAKKIFLLTLSITTLLASGNDQENINPSAAVKFFTPNGSFDPCLTSDNEALCRTTDAAIRFLSQEQGGAKHLNNNFTAINWSGLRWFFKNQNTQLPVKK